MSSHGFFIWRTAVSVPMKIRWRQSSFCVTATEILDRNNLRDEIVILVHSFKGFQFLIAVETNFLVVAVCGRGSSQGGGPGRGESCRKKRLGVTFRVPLPEEPTPASYFSAPKGLQLPKTVPPTGKLALSQTWTSGRHFRFNP